MLSNYRRGLQTQITCPSVIQQSLLLNSYFELPQGRARSTAALGKRDLKEPLHQQISHEQALLASNVGSSKLFDQIEGPEVTENLSN
jgi:hypothetical protein